MRWAHERSLNMLRILLICCVSSIFSWRKWIATSLMAGLTLLSWSTICAAHCVLAQMSNVATASDQIRADNNADATEQLDCPLQNVCDASLSVTCLDHPQQNTTLAAEHGPIPNRITAFASIEPIPPTPPPEIT